MLEKMAPALSLSKEQSSKKAKEKCVSFVQKLKLFRKGNDNVYQRVDLDCVWRFGYLIHHQAKSIVIYNGFDFRN